MDAATNVLKIPNICQIQHSAQRTPQSDNWFPKSPIFVFFLFSLIVSQKVGFACDLGCDHSFISKNPQLPELIRFSTFILISMCVGFLTQSAYRKTGTHHPWWRRSNSSNISRIPVLIPFFSQTSSYINDVLQIIIFRKFYTGQMQGPMLSR